MISVNYESKENIFYVRMSDDIYLDELFDYFRYLANTYSHLDELLILEDSLDAETKFSPGDFNKIISELGRVFKSFRSVAIAKQLADPKETAIGLLYNKSCSTMNNYFFEVFSTKESALNWLNTFQPRSITCS